MRDRDIVLFYKGAYQIYSSVGEKACFSRGLTKEELVEQVSGQLGHLVKDLLMERCRKAELAGNSSEAIKAIQTVVQCNVLGPGNEPISTQKFIETYLTLPAQNHNQPISIVYPLGRRIVLRPVKW